MWIALAATIALLIWKLVNRGQRVPLIVLLPAFTQYIWFVATPAGQFGYMVPFFHSLQYLLIAWSVQLKVGLAERKRDPSVRYVWSESTRWMAINIVGGVRAVLGAPPSRQPLRQVAGVQHRGHARRDPGPSLLRRRSHLATAQLRSPDRRCRRRSAKSAGGHESATTVRRLVGLAGLACLGALMFASPCAAYTPPETDPRIVIHDAAGHRSWSPWLPRTLRST